MIDLMVGFFYGNNPFVHNLQTLVLILIALDPVGNMLTGYYINESHCFMQLLYC